MSTNTSEAHGSKPSFSGYAHSSIGLSTGILLLFAFITVILYLCARRIAMNPTQLSRVRHANFILHTISIGDAPGTNSGAQFGVDEEKLKSYPVLLYSEAKHGRKGGASGGDSAEATCSICLGDFSDSEWLRELPDCHHFFHQKCIDMWLRMNSSCPLCRMYPLPTSVSTPLAEVAPFARSGA